MLITMVMITFQIQIAKFFSRIYMFVVHIRSRNMEKETNFTPATGFILPAGEDGRGQRGAGSKKHVKHLLPVMCLDYLPSLPHYQLTLKLYVRDFTA